MEPKQEIKPLNVFKPVEDYQCLDCDSQSTAIVEIDDIKSAEKVKRHICLICGSDKLVKICPVCKSLGLVYDDCRDELSCNDCGTVIECPPPYYVDGVKVIPFSQVIRHKNINYDIDVHNRKTHKFAPFRFHKADKDVLGDRERNDPTWVNYPV